MSCNNFSTKLPELHDLSLSGLLPKEQLHWSRLVAFLLTSSNQISPAFVKAEAVPCKSTKSKPTDFINWVKPYVHQEWRGKPDMGQVDSILVFRAYLHEYHYLVQKNTSTTSDPLLIWWVASGKTKTLWDRKTYTVRARDFLSLAKEATIASL